MSEIRGEKATEVFQDGRVVYKQVLDHGFVRFVESYGSDESIIEAARMSTQKGFEGWGLRGYDCPIHGRRDIDLAKTEGACCEAAKRIQGDEKLLGFLWTNRHTTPFEMAGAIIEVQAPIFVFREWHRHRTQSYNEMSARYAPLPDVNYIPSVERLMVNAVGSNKQANRVDGAAELTPGRAEAFRSMIGEYYRQLEDAYQLALKNGVPKELARVILPVGRYSRMRASANLLNWMRFLSLRDAPNAQWEIREYARVVYEMLVDRFPRTMSFFAVDRRV